MTCIPINMGMVLAKVTISTIKIHTDSSESQQRDALSYQGRNLATLKEQQLTCCQIDVGRALARVVFCLCDHTTN